MRVTKVLELLATHPTTTMQLHPLAQAFLGSTIVQALNITIYNPNTTLAPSPLPPPSASSQGEEIIRQFTQLSRTTTFKLVQTIPFEGTTFEPEGLVRLGDNRFFVSSGEYTEPTVKYSANDTVYINGTDRTAGAGFGHMLVFDGQGHRIADASITEPGSIEYHNGGIDYDGTYIWATLAQYRPNSTATLVRMDPNTLEPETLLRVADHQGGAVHDIAGGAVLTLNWGSRAARTWDLRYRFAAVPEFATAQAEVVNPSFWADYQDCKYLGRSMRFSGRPVMVCCGITSLYGTNIGGVALVDMVSMAPLWEVPLTMVTEAGNLVTKNPMDVAVVEGKMRFYFLPDEFNSTLYVYEAAD